MAAFHELTIDKLAANFELLDEWETRYAYLIDVGDKMPSMNDADKTEDNRVKGCQATVWLKASREAGPPAILNFSADSNSRIVKGLVAILVILHSGKEPRDILAIDAKAALQRLDLEAHLSPTRKTGLHAMTKQIREIAAAASGSLDAAP